MITLDINEVHPSKNNPRTGKTDLIELVASIKAIGIIQPPTVRKNREGYEVLWGHRRVAAAKEAGLKTIDCIIVEIDDKAALVAATSENMIRTPMDPMDQFEAFHSMHKDGLTVAQIAATFGISDDLVNRRLRLAELHPTIKKAYRKEDVDLDACMAYTLTDQKTQLLLFNKKVKTGWSIRQSLTKEAMRMEDARFDPKLYTGPIMTDLFEGMTYAQDGTMFMSLQREWCEAQVVKLSAKDKHAFIHFTDKPFHEQKQYQYGSKGQKTGLVICLSSNGKVTEHTEIVLKGSKTKTNDAGEPEKKIKVCTSTKEVTTGQQEYLACAYKLLFIKKAVYETATRFFLANLGQTAALNHDFKEVKDNFVSYVAGRIGEVSPDKNVIKMSKDLGWNLRSVWTPDIEFIKRYSTPQLLQLAKEIDVKVQNNAKKGELVSVLTKAFASGAGKSKDWLPK